MEQKELRDSLAQLIIKTKERCETIRESLLLQPPIKDRRERLRQLFANNPMPCVPKLRPCQRVPTEPGTLVKEIREAVKMENAAPIYKNDKTFRCLADDSFHFADISAFGFRPPVTSDMTMEGFSPPKTRMLQNVTLRGNRFDLSDMLHREGKSERRMPPSEKKKPLHIGMENPFYDLIDNDQSQEGLLNEPPLLIDQN